MKQIIKLISMDTVINSTPNADISKKHENGFFLKEKCTKENNIH